MSTINAQNFGDGTDSVPASAVLEGTAKAWVNYNHSTTTIRNDYNVSSVTDNGTGTGTVNFTNAFDAADNYISVLSAAGSGPGIAGADNATFTASARSFEVLTSGGSPIDVSYVEGVSQGDLA